MPPSATGEIDMRRRIDLQKQQYEVTVFGRPGDRFLQVDDGDPLPVSLSVDENEGRIIQLGEHRAAIQLASRGERVYVHAFGRTFSLRIVDPVEQAAQASGGRGNRARAPMPGTVVEVNVTPGDHVEKGQTLLTIESMKILTVIPCPRSGKVAEVHYAVGDTFDKNAVLVTLVEEEE
jgi:3-methylcrotonyl-CoA carboxylase alpha subunit